MESLRFSIHDGWDPATGGSTTYAIDFGTTLDTSSEDPVVRLEFSLDWDPDEDGRQGPFSLAVTVAGRFRWIEFQDDPEFENRWLRYNGLYLLWPYLRQQVSTITGAAGFPPLYLETLQVALPDYADENPENSARHA